MTRVLGLLLLTSLGACNTVAGVGEDVSGGARTVQSWLGV